MVDNYNFESKSLQELREIADQLSRATAIVESQQADWILQHRIETAKREGTYVMGPSEAPEISNARQRK